MKRIIAVLLVLAVVFCVTCSVAEKRLYPKDEYFNIISSMNQYYKSAPDRFDETLIMNTHLNFVMYVNSEVYDFYSLLYFVKESYEDDYFNHVRPFAIGCEQYVKMATDGYLAWLNGEMDNAEYAKQLMGFVNEVVDNHDAWFREIGK